MTEIYGLSELMNSGPLVSVLVKIKELVNLEVRLMTNVQEIMGSLDLLFAVAENQTLLAATSSAGEENGMVTESNTVNGLVEGHSLLSQIGSLVTQTDHMIKT